MGRRKCRNRKRKNQRKILAAAAASSSDPPPDAPSSSEPLTPWVELPGDVTANILQRLGAEEILRSAQQVCTTWWKVCQDPAMWRVIDMCNPEQLNLNEEYTVMCRRAVDRSQGQLLDLTLDYFGDEELMEHIADCSRNLKRLKLGSCYHMSGASLIQSIAKLGHLEELHLTIMPWIFAGDIETIGNSCPKLKSFSYNECGSKHRLPPDLDDDDVNEGLDRNDYALAIGKSMPNLRHLQLFAHWMQNEGLEAILNGCPYLESLDIRQCFDLDLGGDLGKRCRERINDLRLPNDSISDISWLVGDPFEWDSSDSFGSVCCFSDYEYDYDYYEDYECYDDYFSPLGYGVFNGDGPGLFDCNYF